MLAGMTSSSGTGRPLVCRLPEIAVVFLLALLTLNRLDVADVCGGNEAAMAVYVQQMIAHKEFMFPLDNCHVPMYKPPLYHWTATALAALFGQTRASSLIVRLPSALYAIAAGVITMLFSGSIAGRRASILSGLLLCGSYQYISDARVGLVDMTLTFFITASLYTFFQWFMAVLDTAQNPSRTNFLVYVLALTMALGVLAKGPVGLILPATAIVVFLVTEEAWRAFTRLIQLGPILVVVAISSSWYLACLFEHHWDFLDLQLGKENFGRFFGSLGSMAPWYYLRPLLLNSVPFSLLVPLAVVSGLRGGRPLTSSFEILAAKPRAMLAARFLAIFWVCTLVFFELASYKRRTYLLPLWPASAVLLAWWLLHRMVPRLGEIHGTLIHRIAVGICLVVSAGNFFFIPADELHKCGAPLTLRAIVSEVGAGSTTSSLESVQSESYRGLAREINHLTSSKGPLYIIGMEGALEPFVFYLGRCVTPLRSMEGLPSGYIVISETLWSKVGRTSRLTLLKRIPHDDNNLVLVRSIPGSVR
jgi:4-amino-4-deoxy-L-arabinose transferase-like glycosyltransferase